ncbi:hypothetical protein [Oceanospirillum sediminis]|uniref:Uncharacterized protein n=1 Tax=Oceanospirillum sediminis TaxID=2760088 RepID=A0A839IN11_9GAMM|nr:hypothetical protein [Oceanospirillum sediminis]MBB1485889.1 hypothetical protein [Oceanospirillum sediminis]
MTQMRILARNLHDVATLTATSEAMPVAYTQRSERPMVWRSANLQKQVLNAVLPHGSYINCIAIARHNLGALGNVQIEILQDSNLVHDSGDIATAMLIPAGVWRAGIDPWGASYNDKLPGGASLVLYWLDTPIIADSYRITMTSSSDNDYFEVGRIFAGLSFSPSVNMSYGLQLEWLETGEHVQTEGGSLRTIGTGDLRRSFTLKLDWLNETDRQKLITELVKNRMNSDLLVCLYPESDGVHILEHTMVCRRINSVRHVHSHYQNWQSELSFMEV